MKNKPVPWMSRGLIFVAIMVLLWLINGAVNAQTAVLPWPSSYFADPSAFRAAYPMHPHVGVVVGDTTAYAPDGTRYVLPEGTVIAFTQAEMWPHARVTYWVGSNSMFHDGFEGVPYARR